MSRSFKRYPAGTTDARNKSWFKYRNHCYARTIRRAFKTNMTDEFGSIYKYNRHKIYDYVYGWWSNWRTPGYPTLLIFPHHMRK